MNTEIQKNENTASVAERRPKATPRYNVMQKENAYQVRVYLPGVSNRDASITLENGMLVVEAKRPRHWDEKWRELHREIPDTDYRLALKLNLRIEEDSIRADSQNGVLTINLPVAEEARARKIKIN
ncbi:MAG: Hsp20/alpha crystallin family protein [Verrucomicrobiota bacterium]